MTDLLVPPSHIPRLYPLCPKCGSAAYTIVAQPFAEGYHRRHRCKDGGCGHQFFTLAPYNGSAAQMSAYAFKDRPLTDAEISEREQWWEQFIFGRYEDVAVPPHERMRLAFLKPEGARDEIDIFLVEMSNQISTALKEMEE